MRIDQELSARINIARLMLIGGIVLVHVPFDQDSNAYLGQYGAFDWMRVFFRDVLFRIGVPCLSAISGLLLFRTGLENLNYRKIVEAKFISLFLPFLLWNVVLLLAVTMLQSASWGNGYFPNIFDASYRELANLVLATETMPLNLPLYFLRDLLLCIVLFPVLGTLVQRYPLMTLSILLVYVILPVPNLIFLKKSIIFGFCVGAAVALHEVNIKKLDHYARPLALAVLIAALLLFIAVFKNGLDQRPLWLDVLYNTMTLVGGLGAWVTTRLLLETRLGKALVKAPSGLSFWIFCIHYPILMMAWMIWGKMNIDFYPLFYVAVVPLTFALALASHFITQHITPGLYALATGRRKSTQNSATSPHMAESTPLALGKGD